jgi:hypothetical protein
MLSGFSMGRHSPPGSKEILEQHSKRKAVADEFDKLLGKLRSLKTPQVIFLNSF